MVASWERSSSVAAVDHRPSRSPRPMDWASVPETLLLRACAAGDHDAFAELVRRYERPLYRAARRLVGDDEAWDATQQALLQAYLALPSARLDPPVRPWLFRILRNQCLDRLRRRDAVPFSQLSSQCADSDDELPIDAPDSAPLPDELAERADLQEIIDAAIQTLPARYRPVVVLRYADDLSFAEIADRLAVPEPTARTLFQRAKAMLRRSLSSCLVPYLADSPK